MSNSNPSALPSEVKKICCQWRKRHLACHNWSDEEVIEAILFKLCSTDPDRVSKRRRLDGEIEFTIRRPNSE